MAAAKAPVTPRRWNEEEVNHASATARSEFRVRRLDEPQRDYATHYPDAKAAADTVIGALSKVLSVPASRELVSGIVGHKEQFSALRSLAAVPISADDMETLLDASLSPTALRQRQGLADDLARLLKASLDPNRFPWIAAERAPTATELEAAQLATAVLTAVSAVQANRRGEESKALEGRVNELLLAAGYELSRKPGGGITQIAHFPQPGRYVRQCTLARHNADFVVRLKDERLLAIECKASNSEVNGRKRLNKEVVVDAVDWYQMFGKSTVVVAAALRGVFNSAYVRDAQAEGVYIFWWHDMSPLTAFLSAVEG